MDKLWNYVPLTEFTNKNAGFSMWCYAEFNGRQYFIKQFLSPKYPADDNVSSPASIARKQLLCEEFEKRQRKLYSALSAYSDGNDVYVRDFFRVESRYYTATERIQALPWTIETVAACQLSEQRRLCAIIAHAIAALHRGHLVHSDIKHDNILFTETQDNAVTAKVIDFDGGFFENDPPAIDEDVTGDIIYLSPEVCARAYEQAEPLTCKLDVFALGVLFHQYFTGELPQYDTEEYSCPGDAVLREGALRLSPKLPEDVAALLWRMLQRDPAQRPTAQQVFMALRPVSTSGVISLGRMPGSSATVRSTDADVPPPPEPVPEEPEPAEFSLAAPPPIPVDPPKSDSSYDSPFHSPGDLL